MSEPQAAEDDEGVVAIHICERCDNLLRARYPNDRLANEASVCGVCGIGPITRIFGAAKPVEAAYNGAQDAGCRALVVECYRIRDTDEWDLHLAINIAQVAPEDERETNDPIVSIGNALSALGCAIRVTHHPEGLDDGDGEWDSQIVARVQYPEEDTSEMTTFWEFLDEGSDSGTAEPSHDE